MSDEIIIDEVLPFDLVHDQARGNLDHDKPLLVIGTDNDGDFYVACTHDSDVAIEMLRRSLKVLRSVR